ncbi:hypothetical protein PS1M3_09820 [Pseudoalteromonas sp. PS1M3]|nr:hypothetical protein PS1M3_09820 [Pseudoalteromonas sp. PS1M3]
MILKPIEYRVTPYYVKVKKSLIDKLTSVLGAITSFVKLKLHMWHIKITATHIKALQEVLCVNK